MKIGSLFSGIGGLELGLEAAFGAKTIWQCESDPYARKVLHKHWGVHIYDDIRHIDGDTERPDILCGGFPCQDISIAGKRAGLDGAKSGLWREFSRCIRLLQPRLVIAENVPALLVAGRGMGRVLGDLYSSGYGHIWWDCLPATSAGAPHKRDRVFIAAWRSEFRGALADSAGLWGPCDDVQAGWDALGRSSSDEGAWRRDPADGPQPRLGRMAARIRGGVHNDRLRCLGNAVVPQVAYTVGVIVREMVFKEGEGG
tara:strand:+ start:2308 stop:3075 length:768 start_codon:yes stop_codon:yes gene_type:complete